MPVARATIDDDATLVALFRAQYTPMLRTAWLLLGDEGAAEEVVQEAFLRFHQAAGRVREPDRAESYLRSTVMNLARGRRRRSSVAAKHNAAESEQPSRPLPDDEAVRRDQQQRVVASLRRLPTRQRECLVLRYYLDLSEADIATTLGISKGAVKTHVHRARETLVPVLEDLR